MIKRNKSLTRLLIMSPAISPIERPWLRKDTTSAPKSCTAPMKIEPTTTQIKAGSHPDWITFSPDGEFAYAANAHSNDVTVIAVDSMETD